MTSKPDAWTIITADECVWCTKAKQILKRHRIEFTEFNFSEHPNLKDFVKANGLFTVPQVFRNGSRVGGYEDLKQYLAYTTPRN